MLRALKIQENIEKVKFAIPEQGEYPSTHSVEYTGILTQKENTPETAKSAPRSRFKKVNVFF